MLEDVYADRKKNKKIMRKLAKELNVYPRGANVYAELRNYLLNGIAI